MEHEIITSEPFKLPKKETSFFAEFFHDVFSSPFFYIPLFLKIAVGFFLASNFATELFIPFIHYFTLHPTENPYQYFKEIGNVTSFPYPFGMLLIMSAPFALFGLLTESTHTAISHIDLLLLRTPLLLADIGILCILIAWFKRFQKEVLILYWMSPVLFYISYIHGQLDVVPIFFLFTSLYYLTKERDYLALIFLGCALATKTGMVIIVPFIALYLLKERKNVIHSLIKLTVPCIVFFIVNAHVLFTEGFIEMVFKTKEEFKVFDLMLHYNQSLVVYVVPGAVLLLLFYFATLRRYSRNVLMTFLGFSFFILLLCIPPRQGWYFWVIPFAVYFYVQKPWRSWLPLYLLSCMYFVYFAVVKDSDFFSVFAPSVHSISSVQSINTLGERFGLPMDMIVPLVFTLLQGTLLLNIYILYKHGVSFYTQHKLYYKPFLLGIAGDSGSGKTTLTELLTHVFSSHNTTVVTGDDMHKWERGSKNWQEYTQLDPLANELHADINNIYALKQGRAITRRQYDHTTGTFTEPKVFDAKRLVIFEGLHTFFLESSRKAFDLKIYIAPEDQVRLHWKILRDSKERGYTKEQILTILDQRKDDSAQFIAVQEKHADIVFSLRNDISLGKLIGEEGVILSPSLFITCANDIYMEPLLDALAPYFSIDYVIHDDKQRIKCHGYADAETISAIGEQLLPELDDLSSKAPVWEEGYHGVMQLFVVLYMFRLLMLKEYDA